MRSLVFLLLFLVFTRSYAEGSDIMYETYTPLEVGEFYDKWHFIDRSKLQDVVDKDRKIKACVSDYILKQSKTYAKIVQNNLYDLIHNMNKIEAMIYGRKYQGDDRVTREEKLRVLAETQCEAYYNVGILK